MAGQSRASLGPGAVNDTGPWAGVLVQRHEGAFAPTTYYSAHPLESNNDQIK